MHTTICNIEIPELTLTMISSTVTEPLSGLLGWLLVSKLSEQGLNTYWRDTQMIVTNS